MGNNSNPNAKNPALTARGRFNPNPTRVNHPSCIIAAQSKRDKKNYELSTRHVIVFTSKARGIFYSGL